jgi:hypothetical protein
MKHIVSCVNKVLLKLLKSHVLNKRPSGSRATDKEVTGSGPRSSSVYVASRLLS